MTEVEFHTGLADPVRFACRLLRKAVRQGARATVTAPAPAMALLDRELWTFDERDFVPHVRWRADCPPHLLVRTPRWLRGWWSTWERRCRRRTSIQPG